LVQLVALPFFLADRQQTHARVVEPRISARVHVPITANCMRWAGLGSDVGADVEKNGEALEIRDHGGDGRTVPAGQDADDEHPDGHGGAGVTGGTRTRQPRRP